MAFAPYRRMTQRLAAASFIGFAAAGIAPLLGLQTQLSAPAPDGRPAAKRGAPPKRPRNQGVEAGQRYLHGRHLHPDRASSLRKLQRAFRIAGQSLDTRREA